MLRRRIPVVVTVPVVAWFLLLLFGLPVLVMLVGLYVIWLLIQGIAFVVAFVVEWLRERPEPSKGPPSPPSQAAYSNRR